MTHIPDQQNPSANKDHKRIVVALGERWLLIMGPVVQLPVGHEVAIGDDTRGVWCGSRFEGMRSVCSPMKRSWPLS